MLWGKGKRYTEIFAETDYFLDPIYRFRSDDGVNAELKSVATRQGGTSLNVLDDLSCGTLDATDHIIHPFIKGIETEDKMINQVKVIDDPIN